MNPARNLPVRRFVLAAWCALTAGGLALAARADAPIDPPPNTRTNERQRDPETVDFSRPPKTGLRYVLVEAGKYSVGGAMRREDTPEPKRIAEERTTRLEMLEHIVATDKSGVRALERTYRTYQLKATASSHGKNDEPAQGGAGGAPAPQPSDAPAHEAVLEHPLHGKTFRARWTGPKRAFALELANGPTWTSAPAKLRERLSAIRLRHPVLPLPRGKKRVGDRWTLSPAQLQDYCGDSFQDGPQPTITGSSRLELTGFKMHDGRRCAIIRLRVAAKATTTNHPVMVLKAEGECWYDLEHRIAVRCTVSGSVRTKGDLTVSGQKVSIDLTGKFDVMASVEIVHHDPNPERLAVPR